MRKTAIILPVLASALMLAACSEEPTPEPVPTAKAAAPIAEPSLSAPDKSIFGEVLAKACPNVEPISVAQCHRAGFGSSDVICEFGLGDDEYLRNKATLIPGDGEWVLADPETVCAASAK